MSSIHLTRSAVAATMCAVLAITTAGTAAALTSADPRPQGVAREVAVPVDGARSVARSASRPAVRTERTRPTVTIRRYTDAPGSQRAIDACHLVLWTSAPLWLAGHNYCGYQWLAYVRTGTVVSIPTGRAAGRYVVTGHRRLSRQSGALPRLHADLVLQTCVGRSTGLTLARRLG